MRERGSKPCEAPRQRLTGERRFPCGSVDRNALTPSPHISAPVAPHAGAWIETTGISRRTANGSVASHAGAWIETSVSTCAPSRATVAPHAGAWIETSVHRAQPEQSGSLPMRERGSKPHPGADRHRDHRVAPHAGAWIETTYSATPSRRTTVAPHAGAWIETSSSAQTLATD